MFINENIYYIITYSTYIILLQIIIEIILNHSKRVAHHSRAVLHWAQRCFIKIHGRYMNFTMQSCSISVTSTEHDVKRRYLTYKHLYLIWYFVYCCKDDGWHNNFVHDKCRRGEPGPRVVLTCVTITQHAHYTVDRTRREI